MSGDGTSKSPIDGHTEGEAAKGTVRCPICGEDVPTEAVVLHSLAESYTIEQIRKDHPEWVEEDGACPKCLEFYDKL